MAKPPPHTRLPRLVEGVDVRGLPIGPAEAFVLSCVDGVASELEIAEAAGLEPETIAVTLSTLMHLGAVRFDQPLLREASRLYRPPPLVSSTRIGPIIESSAAAEPHHPAAALYDPRELDEAVDLEPERKRVILEKFYHLDTLNHYQVLSVDVGADKAAIKKAYYEVVNLFHPDRYFGKNLGAFKPKIERVFARVTEAYDTLTRLKPRAEYDAYLASLTKTRELDPREAESVVKAELLAIQRQIEAEARAAERALAAHAEPAFERIVTPPDSSSLGAATAGATPPNQSVRPPDADARKRALARKFGGRNVSGAPPALNSPSIPPVSVPSSTSRERAGEELKRRYEQRLSQAREKQAERYLANAHESVAKKDPLSAVNALRIAASLVPDNKDIGARLEEAKTEATKLLANHYLAQAQYEEREGRFADAARSYGKATLGSPSARTFERAAYCGLMAEADLRVAGDYARKAVALFPAAPSGAPPPIPQGGASAPPPAASASSEEAQARVTLARIYVAAGMKQSGLAEFERAATLSPKDDTIRDWIRRLKRGEA